MRKSILFIKIFLFTTICFVSQFANAGSVNELITRAMAGDHREAGNIERDVYRRPLETLTFFGLKPDMTVVEIWPSRGWYTEILAPVLREQGIYYAADIAVTSDKIPDWRKEMYRGFIDKMKLRPDIYDHVILTELSLPERTIIAPPESADMVLTFRNVHNWMKGGYAEKMFNIFYRTLKPGGVLGVVEHRANPDTSIEAMNKSGYVTEAHVIALAKQAGLQLEKKSDINANPQDTKDHPRGVWTLPPSLRYCKKMDVGTDRDQCFDKYKSIGESDRMVLQFRKPG
jgi:predicted methyltransferase